MGSYTELFTGSVELELPLAHQIAPSSQPLAGKHILICLHNLAISEIISRQLCVAGATTEIVETPAVQSAIDRSRDDARDYDLLLMCQTRLITLRTQGVDCSRLPILLLGEELNDADTDLHYQLRYPFHAEDLWQIAEAAILNTHPDKAQLPPVASHSPRSVLPLLVAEDNKLNQELIREQLEILGYSAVIATDGNKAFKHFSNERFAAVITDANMPHLDGLGLVKAIRKLELNRRSKHRTPVLVLTANTVTEDFDHYLASGVDDILTKPMDLPTLEKALHHWLPNTSQRPVKREQDTTQCPNESLTGWNSETLQLMIGDDPALIRQFLEKFLSSAAVQLEIIGNAVTLGDNKSAAAEAHKLKSSSASIGAEALAEGCRQMEHSVRNGEVDKLPTLSSQLLHEFNLLHSSVTSYLDSAL